MSVLLAKADALPLPWLFSSLAKSEVVLLHEGVKVLEQGKQGSFELIVLHGTLPTLENPALCHALREAKVATPILALLDNPTDDDLVQVLESGADCALSSTTAPAILLAQVHALLRRSQAALSPLRVGDLLLDTSTRRAMRSGKHISLSSTEYNLLELLMRQPGKVISRKEIMNHVWPAADSDTDNVLDVYISYLRNKIDRGFTPALIRTLRGQGYQIG